MTFEVRKFGRWWTGMGIVYHLAELLQQCQVCVSVRWANFYFRIFVENHYACDGFFGETIFALSSLCVWSQMPSFGRPSIWSIFPLWMESNALEKSTNKSVTSSFFCPNSFLNSTDHENLWCGSISPKTILVFSKNFLKSRFNVVE